MFLYNIFKIFGFFFFFFRQRNLDNPSRNKVPEAQKKNTEIGWDNKKHLVWQSKFSLPILQTSRYLGMCRVTIWVFSSFPHTQINAPRLQSLHKFHTLAKQKKKKNSFQVLESQFQHLMKILYQHWYLEQE